MYKKGRIDLLVFFKSISLILVANVTLHTELFLELLLYISIGYSDRYYNYFHYF